MELDNAREKIEAIEAQQLALIQQYDLLPVVPGMVEAWLKASTHPADLPLWSESTGYWFRPSVQPFQQESVFLVLPAGQYQVDLDATWQDKKGQADTPGPFEPTSAQIGGGKYRLIVDAKPGQSACWIIEDTLGHRQKILLPFPGVAGDGLPIRVSEVRLVKTGETKLMERSWSNDQEKLTVKISCRPYP